MIVKDGTNQRTTAVSVNMLSFQMGDSAMMKIQRVTQFRKQCAVLKDEFVGHFHCINITKEQT